MQFKKINEKEMFGEWRLKMHCSTDLSSSVALWRSAAGIIGFTVSLNELYSQTSLLATSEAWSIIYYVGENTSTCQNP